MQVRTVVDGLLRSLSATGSDTQQPRDMEGTGATVPNFLIQPQSATPLDQLEPAQRAEVVQALAGIITKAASRAAPPIVTETATTHPTPETLHD